METKFNFKSQICTDRNQSERLLALGLKKETADCYYWQETEPMYGEATGKWHLETLDSKDNQEHFEYLDKYFGVCLADDEIPAWSLHRLIEMMPEEIDRYFCTSFLTLSKHNVYYNESVDGAPDMEFEKNNLYDSIIDCIEWLIKEGYFNKKYLEE